jgi:cell cycle checkpoint protein
MAQGRTRRKKTVLSSDDEDDSRPTAPLEAVDATETETEPTRRPPSKAKPSNSTSTKTRSKVTKSPTKPRQTRQATKPTAEAQPRPADKPISSFFKPAAQSRQLSSQHSTPPTSDKQSSQGLDIDDDISADDATPSQSSHIAQTLRKRKLVKDDIADADRPGLLLPSQKFRKVSAASRVPTNSVPVPFDTRPWTERFAPADLSELAVHKKKITDVRNALESALSDRATPRLIVLKGAAGTAKTTTVNLLAKDMGVGIIEWKSPVGTDAASSAFTSYSSQFEDFVSRSGNFARLDLFSSHGTAQPAPAIKDHATQLMLVEEFPNTFAKSSPALNIFRNTILQYLAAPVSSSPAPMVMVISEALLSTTTASADSFTAHRLLGPAILNHPRTAPIEFNNIAPTILTKALDAIVIKEARKSGRRFAPGPAVLKHLAETGDIRSAVSSLEFLCLAGDDSGAWSSKVAFTKSKGRAEAVMTKKEQEALRLISNRESSLGIFHAVGRVVYNKRIDPPTAVPQPPTYLPQHRKPKIPEHDPNNLIDEVGTDTSTFVGALQENYALSCSSSFSEDALDSLNGCIDALSDFDMLSCDRFGFGTRMSSGSAQDNLRQDDMSFQTAVRGILFWLPTPVNRLAGLPRGAKRGDEFKMFFPSSSKLWKEREEFEGTLESVVSTMHKLAVGSGSNLTPGVTEGVAAWKRQQTSDIAPQDDYDAAVTTTPLSNTLLSSGAKTELLLERLPYASQILPMQRDVSQSLITGIQTLTRVSALRSASTTLDDAALDAAEDNEMDLQQSEWTDRPDTESAITKRSKKQHKPKGEFEGGGLHIPVEHAIERLVLSDDDIED